MDEDISEVLMRRLDLKDDQILRASDSIDVKTSIGLVVVTCLATQMATFLEDQNLPWLWHQFQLAFAVALLAAGVFAVGELWPREGDVEAAEALEGWIEELRDFYRSADNTDGKVAETIRLWQLKRLTSNGSN